MAGDDLANLLNDQFTLNIVDGKSTIILDCGVYGARRITEGPPVEAQWAYPVGDAKYPPEQWYAASVHDLTGALNDGYKHSGLDLNLDLAPRGDIERTLGLHVYAVADGLVEYATQNWSGVPMIVIRVEYEGEPLWVRYAHIVPVVEAGDRVKAGQDLGLFANWTGNSGGDHLHFDMALDPFTREWLDPGIRWVDPVGVLGKMLDADVVKRMCAQGSWA